MLKHLPVMMVAVLIPGLALAQSQHLSPEIASLRNEIAAVKLDRALNLTRDQARTLLPLIKDAAQVRNQLRADQEKRLPEIVKALSAVRDDLVKTGTVSDSSRKALQAARGESAIKDVRAKLKVLHEKSRGVLNADQKASLRSFNPRPLDDESGEADIAEGPGSQPMHHRGHEQLGGERLRKTYRVVTSPEFIALVEARAK